MAVSFLEAWFLGALGPDVRAWLTAALDRARQAGIASDDFASAWSGAGRRLGRSVVAASELDTANLQRGGAPFVPTGWGADELGRGLLLLAAVTGTPDAAAFVVGVDELFRKGEMREQQAILRVLAYLPAPAQYGALAADAVRVNVLSVIEALACDNPFPAAHMPELAFNQMVMKAIFNDLPLARVIGLAERNNEELRRMVTAYASERRAAGRPVPADTALVLG